MLIKQDECARCGKIKDIDYNTRLCKGCLIIWNKIKYGRGLDGKDNKED